VQSQAIHDGNIFISGKEAHHILDVMRLKKLDRIVVFDGTGKEYAGFIKDVKRASLTVEITRTSTSISKDAVSITLIQALPKKEKMDYIIEKATELGASLIVAVVTDRTIPRWESHKKEAQVERWQKIASQASGQCGRSDIPRIERIMTFSECVKNVSGCDIKLIAALTEGAVGIKDAIAGFKGRTVVIAIGPEGDFTLDEVKEAKESGFIPVSLGPRVLKSDTAGLASLAILNYEFTNK
jgi:16S rRNA (uracil1498-N3)-methyltransferase